MRRREFVTLLGGAAAAWPPTARAQHATISIGYLHPGWAKQNVHLMGIFRQILAEAGHVEGRNLTAEYRWAEGQYDRLPDLATDLVKHQVTLIVAPNTPASLAAKAASKAIPVVFSAADDPVSLGLRRQPSAARRKRDRCALLWGLNSLDSCESFIHQPYESVSL